MADTKLSQWSVNYTNIILTSTWKVYYSFTHSWRFDIATGPGATTQMGTLGSNQASNG